jgi:LEA14-like dessication related protein
MLIFSASKLVLALAYLGTMMKSAMARQWRATLSRLPWLAIFILGMLSGCRSLRIQEPQFIGFRDLKVPSLGMRESRLTATLDYFNPNAFSLGLETLDLEVQVFDNRLGRATLPQPIRVPAKDTFAIPVSLEVDMRKVLSNAVALGFNREWDIRLDGKAGFRKGGVNLQLPIRYVSRYKVR